MQLLVLLLETALFLIILYTNVPQCHSTEMQSFLQNLSAECGTEVDVTPTEILKFEAGEYDDGIADYKVKCFPKCMMERSGLLVNGKPNEKAIMEKMSGLFDRFNIHELMARCRDKVVEDPCETAFGLILCFKLNMS